MLDVDDLEARIDEEWLATEARVARVRGRQRPAHSRAKSPHRAPAPAPARAAADLGGGALAVGAGAWSAPAASTASGSTSGCIARLQTRIDELERQVASAAAEAAVTLSEAEQFKFFLAKVSEGIAMTATVRAPLATALWKPFMLGTRTG